MREKLAELIAQLSEWRPWGSQMSWLNIITTYKNLLIANVGLANKLWSNNGRAL
jgi:hypothetical protein